MPQHENLTQFFQGKWIWGICPLEKATEQRKSLIASRESFLSVTACAPYTHFLHKRSQPSSFQRFRVGVLPHTREHRFRGHCTAPETTQTGEAEHVSEKGQRRWKTHKNNVQSMQSAVELRLRRQGQQSEASRSSPGPKKVPNGSCTPAGADDWLQAAPLLSFSDEGALTGGPGW